MGTNLWVIDRDGRVFVFNIREKTWQEVSTPELGSRNCFKRISAVEQCAWAISASQEPYLFVHSTELPIRVKVSAYENQRWGILNGWSRKSMFFSDRWAWSSADGKQNLPKDSFHLPSVDWIWEGDWYIDRGIKGDNEGWQYAIDFPRTYYPAMAKTSCVRRRLWSRYYRFDGYDHWIKVPGLTDDPVKHPFQDIAVGGSGIPGQDQGYLAVWAVTFNGKVVYRSGVSEKCPEGTKWIEIPSPQVSITQLSVSQSGVVWAVTWEGVAVVRVGVTYYQPTGSAWVKVPPPSMSADRGPCRLLQVSSGVNSVWALTKDGKVWFRKGLSSGSDKGQDSTGTKWVEMIGKFSLLAVGLNDQVFALSSLGDHIYFRTDVTADELVGRTWKVVQTSRHLFSASVATSLDTVSSEASSETSEGVLTESDDSYSSTQATANLPHNIEFLTWLSSGACHVDSSFFTEISGSLFSSASSMSLISLSCRDAVWRKGILDSLRARDDNETAMFGQYEEAVSQGTAWAHIVTDVPFVSISVGCNSRIWGIAENGTAYFRAGFGENRTTGERWFHISERPPHLTQVSAGRSSVWACAKGGNCWYRQNITDTYPEGTAWQPQKSHVTSLSVGPSNQVWMTNKHSIERRYKVTPEQPQGRGWEVALSECWHCVSVRNANGREEDETDQGEDIVQEVCDRGANSLLSKLDLSEVDIYTAYRESDTTDITDTPISEMGEDEVYANSKASEEVE